MVNSKRSVYLFSGAEKQLKEQALQNLKDSVLGTSSDMDYKVFYGSEACAREIMDYAATFPFFSAKRLVVIKDFEKLAKEERRHLVDYSKNPAKSTYLVIDTKDEKTLEEFGPVLEYINVMKFVELGDHELSLWVKKFLASRGKSIEGEAMEILKELVGKDLSSITRELEKLAAFSGERKVINSNDVEELVGKSVVGSGFEIGWAIGDRNAEGAVRLVSDLMRFGKKPHEITGLLSWHLNRLYKAKYLKAKTVSEERISDILKIRTRHLKQFFRQVEMFGFDELVSKLISLLDADLDMKRTRMDPALILELAVIRLCLIPLENEVL